MESGLPNQILEKRKQMSGWVLAPVNTIGIGHQELALILGRAA